MPAPFINDLCGYRASNGEPNVSDNNDSGSKELSRALFDVLHISADARASDDPGAAMEDAILRDLQGRRPDLEIRRSRRISDFDQYKHLGVFSHYKKSYQPVSSDLLDLEVLVAKLPPSGQAKSVGRAVEKMKEKVASQDLLTAQLLSDMPEESFLKVDLTIGESHPDGTPRMLLGLSSKWSLRTDRAQDCVSQGNKLASMRRGAMPHYAVITMEPRPAMLKILADGSGAIDCVYHLDLLALTQAIEDVRRSKPGRWGPGLTFDRLVQQRRLRDYDELVHVTDRLPRNVGGQPRG